MFVDEVLYFTTLREVHKRLVISRKSSLDFQNNIMSSSTYFAFTFG